MTDYKVGQKVVCTYQTKYFPFEGEIGEIDSCGMYIWQDLKSGSIGSIHPSTKGFKFSWTVPRSCWNDCVKIIEPKYKNMIQTLTGAMKRLIDADAQAQYKAGFRNGKLELTEEGKNELLEVLASDKDIAAKFTARANDIIAEAEKNK